MRFPFCTAMLILLVSASFAMAQDETISGPADGLSKDEVAISSEGDKIATTCMAVASGIWAQQDARPLTVMITRSKEYGTVWRADSVTRSIDGKRLILRDICWKNGARARAVQTSDETPLIPLLR